LNAGSADGNFCRSLRYVSPLTLNLRGQHGSHPFRSQQHPITSHNSPNFQKNNKAAEQEWIMPDVTGALVEQSSPVDSRGSCVGRGGRGGREVATVGYYGDKRQRRHGTNGQRRTRNREERSNMTAPTRCGALPSHHC
jgi:hypothetical protein